MPHGGASERVQMTNLWNKKTIIPHKLTYFLTAKTAPFSRPVHVLLFVIPRSQVETIVHIFARAGVEPYATFKISNTYLLLTMPHPRAHLIWQMLHRAEGEVKKCPKNARGDG